MFTTILESLCSNREVQEAEAYHAVKVQHLCGEHTTEYVALSVLEGKGTCAHLLALLRSARVHCQTVKQLPGVKLTMNNMKNAKTHSDSYIQFNGLSFNFPQNILCFVSLTFIST